MSGVNVGILLFLTIGGTLLLTYLFRSRNAQPAPTPAQNVPVSGAAGTGAPAPNSVADETQASSPLEKFIYKYRFILFLVGAGAGYVVLNYTENGFFTLVTIAAIIAAGVTLQLLHDTPPNSWQFTLAVATILAFAQWQPTQDLIVKLENWYRQCAAGEDCWSDTSRDSVTSGEKITFQMPPKILILPCTKGLAELKLDPRYTVTWTWSVIAKYQSDGGTWQNNPPHAHNKGGLAGFCSNNDEHINQFMPLAWRSS